MRYSTTDTYQLKRDVLSFSNTLTQGTPKHWQKFTADMLFGTLASGSCILSRYADSLKEDILKKNTVERLARKLTEDIPQAISENYMRCAKSLAEENGAIYVDDTDITKPYGKAFEDLGIVRDGSSPVNKLENGYHVTEVTALSRHTRQPISLFSCIHSARSQDFTSVNDVTYTALEHCFPNFSGATYVFDRGYDMNALFNFMHQHHQQFIVRATDKRKLYFKGKWLKPRSLRDRYKGKFKCTVHFNGKDTECWITCVNVQVTASRRRLKLVLIYGLSQTPMMLLTNRPVTSKEDAVRVARMYFMRWRIEEYFRFKKQHLGFENIRVRTLKAMNNLNQFLSMAITLLCTQAEKRETSRLRRAILRHANGQRSEDDIAFLLYRMGLGVQRILARAHAGIRAWFHIGRAKYTQLSFPLLC